MGSGPWRHIKRVYTVLYGVRAVEAYKEGLYGFIRLHTAFYGFMQLFTALNGFIRLYTALYEFIRLYTALGPWRHIKIKVWIRVRAYSHMDRRFN